MYCSLTECRYVDIHINVNPYSLQAWLATFPSLNPYSAAALAAAAQLRSLLTLQPAQQASALVDWDTASHYCCQIWTTSRPRLQCPADSIAVHKPPCGCMPAISCHVLQEALVKSLPSVPAASLQLFFQQISSSTLQPGQVHAAAIPGHAPPGILAPEQQHYTTLQDQRHLLQQRYSDEQLRWRDNDGGHDDTGAHVDCQQVPVPQWGPPERYQVL